MHVAQKFSASQKSFLVCQILILKDLIDSKSLIFAETYRGLEKVWLQSFFLRGALCVVRLSSNLQGFFVSAGFLGHKKTNSTALSGEVWPLLSR